jgi:hypothetical protein
MKFVLVLLGLALLVTATHEDAKFLENEIEKTEEEANPEKPMAELPLLKGFEGILKHVRNPWRGRDVPNFDCDESGESDCPRRVRPPPHHGPNRPKPPTEAPQNTTSP